MRCLITVLLVLAAFAPNARAQKISKISGDTSGVALYGDVRLLGLEFHPGAPHIASAAPVSNGTTGGTAREPGSGGSTSAYGRIYAARGYRVQIYSGGDRSRATQVKFEFMRSHPGVRTYMSYIQPQFRVKVGDYRSREDAAQMYRALSGQYPSTIVPDIVEVSSFDR